MERQFCFYYDHFNQPRENRNHQASPTNGNHYTWSSPSATSSWHPLGEQSRFAELTPSSAPPIYGGSQNSTPFSFLETSHQHGQESLFQENANRESIKANSDEPHTAYRQYDPFQSRQISSELPKPHALRRSEQPAEPARRKYSDVIKSAETLGSKPKLTQSKSVPSDRSSIWTPPPSQTYRRPYRTRSSGDMMPQTKVTNGGKEDLENPDVVKDNSIDVDGFQKPSKQRKEPYWDPKRIFEAKKPVPVPAPQKEKSPTKTTHGQSVGSTAEVLNNGKCTSGFTTTNKTNAFINNDLRNRSDNQKKNNTTTSETSETKKTETKPKPDRPPPNGSGEARSTQQPKSYEKRPESENRNERRPRKPESRRNAERGRIRRNHKLQENVLWSRLEQMGQWSRQHFWQYVWPALQFVPIIAFRILVLLFTILLYYALKVWTRIIGPRLNRFATFFSKKNQFPSSPRDGAATRGFGGGLECNIALPSTGDEAIQRLLGCQGKDPYCILGLHGGCTDEDVKRYYRKQAILVHPDKNREPGAEEAFKILHCAFEQIGTPEKRQAFDREMRESKDADEVARRFGDLLSEWESKLREVANIMRCETCAQTHQRYPVDRPVHEARHCSQCREYHVAKEGDCWVEASSFGFYWTYYACMDGCIYNVTEWARCQGSMFEKMQPDAHHILYTLVTATNQKRNQQQHQQRTAPSAGNSENNIGGKDFEELLRFMAAGKLPKDFDQMRGEQEREQEKWDSRKRPKGKKRRR